MRALGQVLHIYAAGYAGVAGYGIAINSYQNMFNGQVGYRVECGELQCALAGGTVDNNARALVRVKNPGSLVL